MKYTADNLFGTTTVKKKPTMRTISEYEREYVFDVDFDSYKTVPTDTKAIFIKGDKNTSKLKCRLIKSGSSIDVTDITVSANIQEGYGSIRTIACTTIDAITGIVEINLASELVDEEGTNLFEVILQKDNKVIVSQQYSYSVLNSLGEGEIGSESQMTVLQSLIQQVQESKNTVDNIVEELEVTQSDIDEILGMVGGL